MTLLINGNVLIVLNNLGDKKNNIHSRASHLPLTAKSNVISFLLRRVFIVIYSCYNMKYFFFVFNKISPYYNIYKVSKYYFYIHKTLYQYHPLLFLFSFLPRFFHFFFSFTTKNIHLVIDL